MFRTKVPQVASDVNNGRCCTGSVGGSLRNTRKRDRPLETCGGEVLRKRGRPTTTPLAVGAPAVEAAATGYSLFAAFKCRTSRDLRLAAFPLWTAPFWAALSSATTASLTATSASSMSFASMSRRAFATNDLARDRRGVFLRRRRSPTRADLALGNPLSLFAGRIKNTGSVVTSKVCGVAQTGWWAIRQHVRYLHLPRDQTTLFTRRRRVRYA